jgi:hypothetical protein
MRHISTQSVYVLALLTKIVRGARGDTDLVVFLASLRRVPL